MERKILIFAHDSSMYGASLSLLTLLENLAGDEKYKILVLLPYSGEIEKHLNRLSINYQIIPYPRCVSNYKQGFKNKIINIIRYIKRENYILSKLKDVAAIFNPDLIYTNTSVVSVGYTLSKKIKIPQIWHIREFGDFEYLPAKFIVKSKIIKSNQVIFVSNALKRDWVSSNDKKFKVIYNGLPCANPEVEKKRDFPENVKFGLLGAIIRDKGQDIAIKGFLQFMKERKKKSELHFYGNILDKEYYSELLQIIEQSMFKENIHFHQFDSEIESVYENIDVLLSCSKHEGFGRTIVEAMQRGIPVIANASGGPVEIIDHGISGLLYDQTAESLTKNMELLLSNKEFFKNITISAIEKANASFSIERYVSETKTIIENTLK